jgi:PRTRC genetic system protein E
MFFQTMFQMMSPGVDYNLTLGRTETKLTLLVMPKVNGLKDAAQHSLMPFTLSGTPEEIDRGFFPALQQPLQKAAGLLTNMADFEKQADKAAANSKAVKEEKSKTDAATKEKREKYDGFMKKAEEMETAGNLDGALLQLQQARIHATEKSAKTVDDKITAIKAKTAQSSLFDAPTPAPVAPVSSQPAVTFEQPEQSAVAQSASVPAAPEQAQPQMAPPPVYQPMQGQPIPQPAPQPQQPQPAMPPQGYPMYPPIPQGEGYGQGMYGTAPGYGQGYPQNPYMQGMPQGGDNYRPNPSFVPEEYTHDPKEYEGIDDVQYTHVASVLSNHQQSA